MKVHVLSPGEDSITAAVAADFLLEVRKSQAVRLRPVL
jgi:hypothetical protein